MDSERLNDLPVARPREFQLTVNFRSHAGIVNCERSIVELLHRFWPYSIDALSSEEGIVDGHKPIIFTGVTGEEGRNMVSAYSNLPQEFRSFHGTI